VAREARNLGFAAGRAILDAAYSRGPSGGHERGEQLVGRSETPASERWWQHSVDRFEFCGRISAQIDLGCVHTGVSEPQCDFPNVMSGFQGVHSATMAAILSSE
jgi:hypothetical protein